MTHRLADKVAIVLGAGAGYGEHIARRFAQEACTVAVADANETSGKRVVQAIHAAGGRAEFLYCDPNDRDDMQYLVAATLEAFGRIDVCVNAHAGAHRNGALLDTSEAEFERMHTANLKSLYLSTRQLVPHFRSQGGGCYIQIAAATGRHPNVGSTWYRGSIGALIATSRALAAELGRDAIRVNVVNPLPGDDDVRGEFASDTPEQRAKLLASIPLGRVPSAQDVAHAALFLASDEAACITGVCLNVDGGLGL